MYTCQHREHCICILQFGSCAVQLSRGDLTFEFLGRCVLQECDPDVLKEQGLESSDSLSVALCLCCIFGLGQPAMVLMEQGARLDMPLSEEVAGHICGFARKRGLVVCERDMVGATALHLSALCGHPGKPKSPYKKSLLLSLLPLSAPAPPLPPWCLCY